ncbi:MAG: outer membrane protein assembly factor BamD [Prevotella sp.]|nr:outer membrane protein assembly factor BamD [Prevotella sp.]MBR1504573.1 outer membrane protein assembly factor BamD [Prevotella sp.]
MNRNCGLALLLVILLSGCATQFNNVFKSADNSYKYEYAKECFAMGKFSQAVSLLSELVTLQKGRTTAQESLYMLGMAQYGNRDFEAASATFRKYFSSYPKGDFAEQASFYVGQSLFQSMPDPRLDQTATVGAINAYQNFMDFYPDSPLRETAQQRLFILQDNLVMKEYLSAELYYHLGGYFGNINANTESNYESCIITAQNALKAYPYTSMREKFSILIMKSKYELANNSSEEKRVERFREAEDECYGFLNEFPESSECKTAEKYIARCKKITGD